MGLQTGDLFALPVNQSARTRTTSPTHAPARNASKRTIQERFEAWLIAHPEAETLYLRWARELRQKGFKTYSVAAITERIRWHYHLERDDREEFKISNDFRSRMARYIEEKYPEFKGFFNTRCLREKGTN